MSHPALDPEDIDPYNVDPDDVDPENRGADSDRPSSHAPRSARAPRKARAKPSLKMQAIGYLSRREHSRQELRQKLLASLRQREREAAAREKASHAAAHDRAQALSEQPSNGIDDAFAPALTIDDEQARSAGRRRDIPAGGRSGASSAVVAPVAPGAARVAGALATPGAPIRAGSSLDSLRLASGASLPVRLRAELSAIAAEPVAHAVPGAPADLPDAETTARLEPQDPEAVVDQLLDWLVANRYLSEARFVESRVNARARKQGTMMIKYELQRHGLVLEPEQAAALRETEFARAQALWQRKFGEWAPDPKLRARQARFLAARGFASEVVRRVVGGEDEF